MSNDDNPHSTNGSSGKSWLEKIIQTFTGEPKSREELAEVIAEAEMQEVIDPGTREMIPRCTGSG